MKLTSIVFPISMLLTVQATAGESPALNTLKEKKNYAIGVNVVRNLKKQGVDLDLDAMFNGMKDALSGKKLLMSDQDIRIVMAALQNELNQKQLSDRELAKKAYAFLEENKKKEGVMVLPSGLQYRVIKAGSGIKPTDKDSVVVNYRATRIDGTEFASSFRSGYPATMAVSSGTPAGLSEALKLMPVGSKWQIIIPPHLAYGEQGLSPQIGPFETLIYDLEIIAVK